MVAPETIGCRIHAAWAGRKIGSAGGSSRFLKCSAITLLGS
jgi:hypothetical protein